MAFDTAPPLGWTRFTNLDDKILRIGTAESHQRLLTALISTLGQARAACQWHSQLRPGVVRDYIANHQHSYSITTGSPSSSGLPPYKNMLFYSRNNDNVDVALGTEVLSTGFMRSSAITADYLGETQAEWDTFSFTDDETNGDLKYRIYYNDGSEILLLSDAVLAGNSAGFDTSPVDLSGISATTYPTLHVTGTFEYSGGSSKLQDWTVTVNNAPVTPTLDSPANAATNQSLFPYYRPRQQTKIAMLLDIKLNFVLI